MNQFTATPSPDTPSQELPAWLRYTLFVFIGLIVTVLAAKVAFGADDPPPSAEQPPAASQEQPGRGDPAPTATGTVEPGIQARAQIEFKATARTAIKATEAYLVDLNTWDHATDPVPWYTAIRDTYMADTVDSPETIAVLYQSDIDYCARSKCENTATARLAETRVPADDDGYAGLYWVTRTTTGTTGTRKEKTLYLVEVDDEGKIVYAEDLKMDRLPHD